MDRIVPLGEPKDHLSELVREAADRDVVLLDLKDAIAEALAVETVTNGS